MMNALIMSQYVLMLTEKRIAVLSFFGKDVQYVAIRVQVRLLYMADANEYKNTKYVTSCNSFSSINVSI